MIRDEPTLYAYGTDASFYRLTPKRAVLAESPEEISRILKICGRLRLPCTFRAAGTSLSGQSVTDSLLVMLGRGWEAITISKTADRITLGPGVIGARANEVLRPLGRRIGPDPASLDTAKIGGIAANNASGMCCGTEGTSYQTLRSMKVILADGTLLDTGCEISRKSFLQSHGSVLDPLSAMAARVRSDKALSERIRKKYRIKKY